MMTALKVFKPGVEFSIKLAILVTLASAYVVTFAWGYEGHRDARRWREVACSYRLTALQRSLPALGSTAAACETLERVGIGVASAR